ncbi:MAG: hypothetical protein E7679_03180 [Ruminococcaceae bacterium]|nr:hypothetical protein [Oscillospiraceae bacterium]
MNENISTKVTTTEQPKLSFFRRLQQRISASPSSYLALCFIVPAVVMYLVYLARGIYPFGDGSVLVLDLNAQYVYFYEGLRSFAHGDADILYSFSRSLGGEFIGIYAYYVASPLSYIVALFPKERILEALLTIFILKTGLCGFTFGFYLHKNSKAPNKLIVLTLSTMYALSAYGIIHQHNSMWIDAMMLLPLITYGIEQLVKFGKFKLFVLSLALCIWSNYYIGYMVCIYVALYFFYYFLAYGDGRNNPCGEKAHFTRSFIRIAVFSLIAIAMAAFIILGAYYSLGFGKNEFSNPDWTLKAKFGFLDFFTKFLPGSYDTVRPEGMPFVYTGILTLILVPIFFISKKFSVREKLAAGAFLGFMTLSMFASTLDLIWHGFQKPNWLNTRYSFMLCFFLLVLAYKAFGNLRQISEKVILAICAFLALAVAVCEKQEFETYLKSESKLLTLETVWLSIIVIAILFVLLCMLVRNRSPKKRENLAAILAVVVCVELFCSALACIEKFDKDVLYTKYSNYNNHFDDTREITDLIKEGDSSFYRTEFTKLRAVNDSFTHDTFGVSGSTSTLNRSTIDFLNQMGYASVSHWSKYQGGTPVNDSLLGIKYIVDSPSSASAKLYYSAVYKTGKYAAYKNPYALSLAYGVDDAVKDFDMQKDDSSLERLNSLVAAMLGEENVDIFLPIQHDYTYDNVEKTAGGNDGHLLFEAEDTGDASVTFTIRVPDDGDGKKESKEIFFQAPSRYTREVTIYVNNIDKGKYYDAGTKKILSLGVFEEGKEVTVKLKLEKEKLYIVQDCSYFYYMDTAAFREAFTRLNANPQYNISEDFTDSHLTGTITTAKSNQMIQTTIPYDEGWKIYVDGVRVDTYETLDALIAFDIPEAGEHTLEMKYRPTVYTLGMIISIAGICAFSLICMLELISKRFFGRLLMMNTKELPEEELWTLEDFEAEALLEETPKTDTQSTPTPEGSETENDKNGDN